MEETTYNYEIKTLRREQDLKEQIVEGYKNKLVAEILSGEHPIVHQVTEAPKKTFWQRLCDVI